jgi:hypothetical protein
MADEELIRFVSLDLARACDDDTPIPSRRHKG